MALSPAPTQRPTTTGAAAPNYFGSMLILTTLFFIFGFVTNVNDILIVFLKDICEIKTNLEASLVQFAFFGAYFLMALPAGKVLERVGYKRGIVLGLLTMAVGALLFLPAASTRQYPLFLLALGIVGAGLTLLQTAANPYASVLGPPESAASRVSIVGAANSLAGTISPYLASLLLLGGAGLSVADVAKRMNLAEKAALVPAPYIGLTLVLVGLAVLVGFSKMPPIDELQSDAATDGSSEATGLNALVVTGRTSALQFPHLVLGVGAIFFYVGVEVGIASWLIPLGRSLQLTHWSGFAETILGWFGTATASGFSDLSGAVLVTLYWGGAMVGRFLGIPILRRWRDVHVLRLVVSAGLLLVLAAIALGGEVGLWLLVLCGLCNSVMWPILFPLGIRGLGALTKHGSSLLIMGIVGGAIVPLLMGFTADIASLRMAFLLPVACYAYLLYFAVSGHRVR
jgi:MFS transporter, FHS family, L-fucose permease